MKRLIRILVFSIFALWLSDALLPMFTITGTLSSLLSAGIVLGILMIFVAPILKILFIPINIITFGLLSWLVHVVLLYVLTLFVSSVQIIPMTTDSFSYAGFVVPPIHFTYVLSLVVSAIAVWLISTTLTKLTDE